MALGKYPILPSLVIGDISSQTKSNPLFNKTIDEFNQTYLVVLNEIGELP